MPQTQSLRRIVLFGPPPPLSHLEDGHIEGAAAQVEDQDGLVGLAVKAIGEGGGGGLVDDAEDLEAGDLARVLGGLGRGRSR